MNTINLIRLIAACAPIAFAIGVVAGYLDTHEILGRKRK